MVLQHRLAGPLGVRVLKQGETPHNYPPAVYAGLRSAAGGGLLAGYPVINIRVTLLGGSSHSDDSSDMAFMAAASRAMTNAARQGKMTLLEPIMKLEVTVPEAYVGDVLNDLNARRADIIGMGIIGTLRTIDAKVPLAELFGYSTVARSLTQGRAHHTMEPLEYAPVPEHTARSIIGPG